LDLPGIAGISVQGQFENNGLIEIDGGYLCPTGIAVVNAGEFINGSTAWVFIDHFLNHAFSLINTSNVSENHGKIYIDSPNSVIGISLSNADFENYGYILSQVGHLKNVKINPGCTLYNGGEMNLVGSDTGMEILGELENIPGGEIMIQNTDDDGMYISSNGWVHNAGLITFTGSIPGHAIVNHGDLGNTGTLNVASTPVSSLSQFYSNGTIQNDVCGVIKHSGSFYNDNAAYVINKGFWTCTATHSSVIFGDFENAGVMSDVNDSFHNDLIINYGHLLRPIEGPYCVGEEVEDILIIGPDPQYDVKYWYTDSKYNVLAGEYDDGDNAFYIYPDAGGLEAIWIEFAYSKDCSYRMPLGFDPYIQEGQELCGDGIDNDCDGLIDEAGCMAPVAPPHDDLELQQRTAANPQDGAPRLFPNPSTGALQLQWDVYPDLLPQVEIYQTDGRLVWQGQGHQLQPNLPAGMYLVRITSQDVVFPIQKWIIHN
jgi:hypothetical protein